MQYMKLSTSRDFRINAATLDAVLQEQQEPDSQQVSVLYSRCSTETSAFSLSGFITVAHLSSGTALAEPRTDSGAQEEKEEGVRSTRVFTSLDRPT